MFKAQCQNTHNILQSVRTWEQTRFGTLAHVARRISFLPSDSLNSEFCTPLQSFTTELLVLSGITERLSKNTRVHSRAFVAAVWSLGEHCSPGWPALQSGLASTAVRPGQHCSPAWPALQSDLASIAIHPRQQCSPNWPSVQTCLANIAVPPGQHSSPAWLIDEQIVDVDHR